MAIKIAPLLAVICAAFSAQPLMAGNALMPPGTSVAVAKSTLTVTPEREWNRLSARPGRNSETWTLDGDDLNGLNFYSIESGRTLFREVSKKTKPLPRFSSTMLLTDIPALLENSYRIALGTTLFSMTHAEPAPFLGERGVRFSYSFRKQMEDVSRSGEAVGAIVKGRLYLVTFDAPAILYFDRDVAGFRQIVSSARLEAPVPAR
ncbi:hypothetical protein Sphch_0578 [Sphingobium chlorophenolicum L-1]|uniref:Uncharacterized protein n=1 Tax=Sphingobium chlorophenolicum L-1 TaxID=690566 RepID=F6EXZ1_SPHCR|nr:hypothetical protein [Sphingobium chlorophenolicum]AEG48273.1 hypothetical protein Sphch_0578 [Sphingobium chlorophenolicum L-1]